MKNTVNIAGLCAEAGTKVSGCVTVEGTSYRIPITLVNGKEDGKRILITAGIHGCEYPGIRAVTELAKEIDPEQVSGLIILVHCVNMSGYLERTPYVVPADEDRKNLNRMFPTDNTDTLADKICKLMMKEFVKGSDFHVDLHSGDIVEELEDFCMVGNIDDAVKKAFITEAAKRTCFKWRLNSGGRTEFYNGSAKTFGVPAMLFERGGAGSCTRKQIDDNKNDLAAIMKYMEILPGEAPVNEAQIFCKKHEWTEAEAGDEGQVIPLVSLGDNIKEGQDILRVEDMFGNEIRTIKAKYDGHVLILTHTLSIHEHDDLITYGSI